MSAVALDQPRLGAAAVCSCAESLWSNPWPGRPRRCFLCGGLCAADLPCQHLHKHAGTDLCADCEESPRAAKVHRAKRVGEERPAGLTIGELAICTEMRRGNLADDSSPLVACGQITTWRLDGKPWCERCWWLSSRGKALLKGLKAVQSEQG